MNKAIKETFHAADVDADSYSPLPLAYMGDCVYEMVIRTLLLARGNAPVNTLNKKGSSLAKAATQSKIMAAIESSLSAEEEAVYKRGRNAKSFSVAKNATVADYRQATGFEALIGWLYLKGRNDRALQLIRQGFEAVGEGGFWRKTVKEEA